MSIPKSIKELSELFSTLPGVGGKLSNRIALYLSISNKSLAKKLSVSINEALENIRLCSVCSNISENELCDICDDDRRDKTLMMVVESPLDLYSIEESAEYDGVYHVLNGVISPVNGVGPDDLSIEQLKTRLREGDFREVIFGLNTNLEGESTTLYIRDELEALEIENLATTRLAKGMPVGSSIEYLSHQTISDSIMRRSNLD